jgi:hypothetical protein
MAAFEHVRRLGEVHDHLTAAELKPGFVFNGERIPLVNPQRGIFKPQQMQFLLSIKTVFPKPGGKVWYDDQREVHRQIFEGDETIDYAFMGQDPDAGRQPVASRGVREPDTDHLFPRHRSRSLPGHAADLHLRVGRKSVEGACGVRSTRSRSSCAARDRARTALRPACRQTKAAPSVVPRSRYHRLQRPLRAIGTSRVRIF